MTAVLAACHDRDMALTAAERKARSRAKAAGTLTTVTVDLDGPDLAWLDEDARRRGVDRPELLRMIVTAQRKRDEAAAARRARPSVHSIVASVDACGGFKASKGNPLRCDCGRLAREHP